MNFDLDFGDNGKVMDFLEFKIDGFCIFGIIDLVLYDCRVVLLCKFVVVFDVVIEIL